MSGFFFSTTDSLVHLFVVGVLGYISLILILRITGNRTLSKMNSFDFIITIALGSSFASALHQKSVALSDAVGAFVLLAGLQFIITWLSVRFPRFNKFVKGNPVLLFAEGEFLRQAMKKAHVTEDEVISGIRQQGVSSIEEVSFVVLEANGKIVAAVKKLSSEERPAGEGWSLDQMGEREQVHSSRE